MNELIPLHQQTINSEMVQTVSARELHEFLEVQTAFKDWIARRIADYDFDDGIDFCSILSESSGGRPSREYYITLDYITLVNPNILRSKLSNSDTLRKR